VCVSVIACMRVVCVTNCVPRCVCDCVCDCVCFVKPCTKSLNNSVTVCFPYTLAPSTTLTYTMQRTHGTMRDSPCNDSSNCSGNWRQFPQVSNVRVGQLSDAHHLPCQRSRDHAYDAKIVLSLCRIICQVTVTVTVTDYLF
jgi:hypothetical protein